MKDRDVLERQERNKSEREWYLGSPMSGRKRTKKRREGKEWAGKE